MTPLLFERITSWQRKTFGKATPLSKLAHLKKEIEEVELDIASGARAEEEYADCFLLLYGSAAAYGMNLDDINLAVTFKMNKNEQRKWGEPDEKGIVEHIKEGGHNGETNNL